MILFNKKRSILKNNDQQGTFSFNGRRILIAGATGNIGSAVAKQFAELGANLVLHYRSQYKKAKSLSDHINETGATSCISILQADLEKKVEAEMLYQQAVKILGGIDILVNCVGHTKDNTILLLNANDFEKVITANLAPVVYLSECVRQQGSSISKGRIINISSITGLVGQPMRSAYGAAKGAVIAYSKALAKEIAVQGWTVNCIAPQVVVGGLAGGMHPKGLELIAENTPVKKKCHPKDIASATVFLASEQAGFITGTTLNITGGLITW